MYCEFCQTEHSSNSCYHPGHNKFSALQAENARLREALLEIRALNKEHYECEDCWYSCPKSKNCCDERLGDDVCFCGKDMIDSIIDNALKGGDNDQ